MKKIQYPNAKILIVDDNKIDASMLEQILAVGGYTAPTVQNMPQFMAQQQLETAYDLVLLHLNVSDMGISHILSKAKKIGQEEKRPVLVITSQDERELRFRAFLSGANDFIIRPYDMFEVLNRIGNMLELQALQKEVFEQSALIQRNPSGYERQRMRDEFEERVKERTAELLEINSLFKSEVGMTRRTAQELVKARDKAVEASHLKSEFLANVSHEVRTSLNGMIGMISMLLDSSLDSEQKDCALTALKSGDLVLSLTNEILDFAKIESGHLGLETIAFDLRQLVADIARIFAEQFKRKGIDLVSLVVPEVPGMVVGDPTRLRQIITNLVGNALKFTEEGEVIINVGVQSQNEETVTLYFEVKDTGVGIKSEVQGQIFDSYIQADSSTTRKYGGTGLGLAIVKKLVRLMGGEIGVRSEEGVGSRFWLMLPMDKAAETENTCDIPLDLTLLRVLIVGNDKAIPKSLQQYLDDLIITYAVESDSAKTYEIMKEGVVKGSAFQIVILATHKFEEDDLLLVAQIKKDALLKGSKLIIFTTSGERGHAKRAREAGVSAYVSEPVNRQRLLELLTAVANTHKDDAPLITKHSLAEKAARYKAHVLVVEDNEVNQKVAVKMLTSLGHRVDVVSDGSAAVSAIDSGHYDLVFMDCNMPEMDGFEATRQIRALEAKKITSNGKHDAAIKNEVLPIVALTANAREQDRLECLAAGMDDFLQKPVTLEAVQTLLVKWIGDS